jgi:hypothetical protein
MGNGSRASQYNVDDSLGSRKTFSFVTQRSAKLCLQSGWYGSFRWRARSPLIRWFRHVGRAPMRFASEKPIAAFPLLTSLGYRFAENMSDCSGPV